MNSIAYAISTVTSTQTNWNKRMLLPFFDEVNEFNQDELSC